MDWGRKIGGGVFLEGKLGAKAKKAWEEQSFLQCKK
jgi:hypothetical protein